MFGIQKEKSAEAQTPHEMADLPESFQESIREKSGRRTATPGRAYGSSRETLKQRSAEENQRIPDSEKKCSLCRSPSHIAPNCPSAGARLANRVHVEEVGDSGAEFSLVRRFLVPDYQPLGSRIKITGAFGLEVISYLAYVPLRLRGEPQYVKYGPDVVGIFCAVTDKLARGIDVLLTADAYE
ncbi:hypothetical protein HPB47_023762 [Ixodes persulcatus]|uniref:Uncharacterized protein n=1 Tax=Ixodes persulcatus TaxID=34615 RepID=A0AC60Q8G2_IXOPE|nr:hypothetical protein HPB47_023762 [Ixodes persulcatus]